MEIKDTVSFGVSATGVCLGKLSYAKCERTLVGYVGWIQKRTCT